MNQEIVVYLLGGPATLLATIAISTFLARKFARTSLHLEDQLRQVKQLSAAALEHEKVKAEHDRKTKELEEARQLQLSMLPKKLPQLPHLDIAAYMKTATEVGGDYYDFHLGEDGTLTIAVGDATGHGLKAGTMVTAVKSLFDTLAYHPDIPHIFERLTRTLKRMNLRGLFMALTVAKINQHQLVLSAAGMPPVLLYRAASQQVEAVELKALPLGGVANYRYQQVTFDLAAGDVVVLMSDGLPERFNAQGEMLGYEPIQALLAQVGMQTAADIIAALIQAGDEWAGTRAQDDDVTFVVVKVKS
ncbi:MAG TPA: PP2C family protein-serine/threonine phosphatase [Blastocatellia bacterium]|nr:PP2C family protein-serine/threonine phosphatase [Blastocatellia bacterium]